MVSRSTQQLLLPVRPQVSIKSGLVFDLPRPPTLGTRRSRLQPLHPQEIRSLPPYSQCSFPTLVLLLLELATLQKSLLPSPKIKTAVPGVPGLAYGLSASPHHNSQTMTPNATLPGVLSQLLYPSWTVKSKPRFLKPTEDIRNQIESHLSKK